MWNFSDVWKAGEVLRPGGIGGLEAWGPGCLEALEAWEAWMPKNVWEGSACTRETLPSWVNPFPPPAPSIPPLSLFKDTVI